MIRFILAADLNNAIGNSEKKPFNLPWDKIPEDFAHYKRTTLGNVTIMGRKTYESIGRPLPGRETIILSKTLTESPHPDVKICSKPYNVYDLAPGKDIYVCGGGETYKSFAPAATEIILTRVHAKHPADCFFDETILQQFFENEDKRITLREQTSELPLVTVHYYERKSVH